MRADYWNILEPVAVDPARKSWKDVLRNLIFHANLEGVAWPSVATIRAETGYKSAKAVIDALAGLRSLGLIAPVEDSPKKAGRGNASKWVLSAGLSTLVDKLEKQADIPKRDTVKKGEVGSPLEKKVNLLPKKGEPTSKKGEPTSTRIYKEIYKVSKSVSMARKGEPTSPFVDNSENGVKKAVQTASAEEVPTPHSGEPSKIAPAARNDVGRGAREPATIDISELVSGIKAGRKATGAKAEAARGATGAKAEAARGAVGAKAEAARNPTDYLALCSELGWKPNDRETVPDKAALEQARRAVVACAYREGLSAVEAKKFLRWNAGRKWSGVDRASCVRDLAKLWLEKWRKESWDEYCEERRRRSELARLREERKLRAQVAAESKA